MSNGTQTFTDKEILEAVEKYVYNRNSDLTTSNIMGIDEEDLERIITTKDGYLQFSVEDMDLERKEEEDGIAWYVEATIYFDVSSGERVEGGTDTYECYRCENEWCINWHSS